jgi:hypothetical protein
VRKTPKWLYRLESTDPKNGLWYNSYGEYAFAIGGLPNCRTKNLPMGYDERYQKNGRNWYSSCTNPKDLAHWFSLEDALELMRKGFRFMKYLATEYTEYPMETVFIKDSCLASEEVDPRTLY